MWSRIPQGFALFRDCGDAVLHKFRVASAEADDKEFGPARLKTKKKKEEKKTTTKPVKAQSASHLIVFSCPHVCSA